MRFGLAPVGLSLILSSSSAFAFNDCFPRPGLGTKFSAATVISPRVNFQTSDGGSSGKYVVKGDEVITFRDEGNRSCAVFLNSKLLHKHKEIFGIIDGDKLHPIDPATLLADNFLGEWSNGSDQVKISAGKNNGNVLIEGAANFGQGQLDENGNTTGDTVNYTGQIGPVEVPRSGNQAGFTLAGGELSHHPVVGGYTPLSENTDETGCAAKFELLSRRYLYVEDNQRCGGMNVTFTGLYIKKK